MKHYSRRELYALGEPLGESVTQAKVGGGRIYGGGGSGGGGQQAAPAPQQNTTINTNIPEYARPYVESMLGAAQKQAYKFDDSGNIVGFQPYVPYGATVDAAGNITNSAQEQAQAAVAGFSPMQEQAFKQVANMQVPGQYGLGSTYAGAGGTGAANIAQQAAGIGGQYYNMATNPYAQQAFMSPYMQNAVDVQKQEAIRDFSKQMPGLQAQATRQGAFGGSRQAIEAAEARRNLNTQLGQIQAQGSQRAFEQGQQAQQFGANLGLQGYNTALQGTGQLTAAGRTLADIGGAQLQAQQGIIGLQTQAGAQQQALEQQRINQAIQNYALQQQNPQMQLSLMSSLTRGLPLQQATTQQYQAAPSAVSQIGGLGLTGAAAYNLFRKEGGIIKSYAKGGEVEDDTEDFADGGITRKVLLNPDKYSTEMIDRGVKSGVIDDIVGLAALQQKNQETKERQAAAAMAQGTPPTIKDQIIAEAQQLQGIDNAQSNLPTEYAGGGIVAFNGESGSQVEEPKGYFGRMRERFGKARESTTTIPDMPSFMGIPLFGSADTKIDPKVPLIEQGAPATPAPAAAPAAPQDLTVIRNKPTGDAKPSIMNPPAAAPAKDTGMSGIDDLIRQSIGDIKASGQASKDARKEAKLMAMLQAGLGIMSGTSPYAAANVKGALPALQGYQEEMRGIRGDEAKQIAQIAALNLKGAELKQELNKLGVTKEYYDSQIRKNDAYARYLASGKGTGGGANYGPITNETYLKLKGQYDNFMVNPKSDPTLFAALPKRVKDALKADVGTPSYDRGLAEVRDFANQRFANDINTMRVLAARKGPNASAPYNPEID
jgi:hypothetical protein